MRMQCVAVGVVLMIVLTIPAFGQVVLTGEWISQFHEDFRQRLDPGLSPVDYLGLPINDAARLRALSWTPSLRNLREHECQPVTAEGIYRLPMRLRIWEERDPQTHSLVAIKNYISAYEQTRTIYMDGRSHPPDYAAHTWMGFSTGHWEGDILTVTTTHLKQGSHQPNGIASSDFTTLTDYFIRHTDQLTHVTVVQDPAYLTEPFIRSENFVLATRPARDSAWAFPCTPVEDMRTKLFGTTSDPKHAKGAVPAFLPGENEYLHEFADKNRIPLEAALGGAETMYPEYQLKLKQTGPAAPIEAFPPAAQVSLSPAAGSARAAAKIDFTGYWVSLVTEDWIYRMVTPPKGDFSNIPMNRESVALANSWDPAKAEAAGNPCLAYGAPGLTRVPARWYISWANDDTLRVDVDAGSQTRMLYFPKSLPKDAGKPSLQGTSAIEWDPPDSARSFRVATRNLSPGYLRKNGVPYSGDTLLTEYFDIVQHSGGDQYLIVTSIVQDAHYLTQPFVTSTHFKKQADASGWRPSACSPR